MLVNITKSVTELVEVSFPCYFKRTATGELFYMKDAITVVRVMHYGTGLATINTDNDVPKETATRWLSDSEFITDKQFKHDFIKAMSIIGVNLPDDELQLSAKITA